MEMIQLENSRWLRVCPTNELLDVVQVDREPKQAHLGLRKTWRVSTQGHRTKFRQRTIHCYSRQLGRRISAIAALLDSQWRDLMMGVSRAGESTSMSTNVERRTSDAMAVWELCNGFVAS